MSRRPIVRFFRQLRGRVSVLGVYSWQRRLMTLFICLLLGPGQAIAAVSTSDLAGTWRGTMTSRTSNPIYFTCDASGAIISGVEEISPTATVTVSGNLTVGGGGAVTGTMIFSFSPTNSVQATASTVNMTVLASPSRLQIQGDFMAGYQTSGIDTLSVIRDEPYVSPDPEVAVTRGGSNISDNGTDAFPFIGVMGVPEVLSYTLGNSGNMSLTVGAVVLSGQTNCSVAVTASPTGSISSGASSTLGLSVTPTAAGAWSCIVSFDNNDPDEDPFNWTISGSATASPQPELQIQRDGTTISSGINEVVGNVNPGQSLALSYAVNNLGSAVLMVGPLNLTGALSNCTVTVDVATATVPARGTSTFTLTITPINPGPWSLSVSEPSNDSSERTTLWSISGTSREMVAFNNQNACGLGGGFALFALAFGLVGMSLFTSRSRSRRPFMLVGATAIATLLLSASRISAVEWHDDDGFYDASLVNDWRLGYTMLPTRVDISLKEKSSGYSPNYDLDSNWDQAGRTGVLWMPPWCGLSEYGEAFFGLELSTNHCVFAEDVSPFEIDLRTYQLTVHPGLSWLLDDNFHVEINPFMSLGYAQLDTSTLGSNSDLYYEIGLRLAAYYTWRSGFQFGLQTGYLYGATMGEINGSGSKHDWDIRFYGIFLGGQLGYRF